jgi:hypothetical protein
MKRTTSRVWPWLLCGLVALPAGGCGVVSDVFAPGLAEQFGLDPATIKPPQGVLMVSFKNATQSPATFFAFEATDASDLSRGRNFSVPVAAGSVGNEVLDCPVGIVIPGSVGASNAISTNAAEVQSSTALTVVTYTGPTLLSGQSFNCGDVLEIGLFSTTGSSSGGTATQTYTITVRLIPGQ